jgi:preprotein translocase subunit YajC
MTDANIAIVGFWTTLALQEGGVQGVLGAGEGSGGAAQGVPAGAPAGSTGQAPAGGLPFLMPILFVMVGFLFLSTILGGRKEKKRRAKMLGELKKRDRVQTVGGVIGNIIEIKGDEFLIESDRASNTRLWVTRASVSSVIRPAASTGSESTGSEVAEAIPDKTNQAASV